MTRPSFQEGVRNRNREAFIPQLHEEAPIYKDPAGFWVVSRFEDVRAMLLDHASYSSQAMGGDGLKLPLITDDPPRHSSLRALVSKAFTPARIEALRPEVSALAEELVARIEPGAEVDIVQALTTPLPVTVIARMLGIPEQDYGRFKRWSNALTGADGFGPARDQALRELHDYFCEVLAARRENPGTDLVSALAAARDAGVHLSDEEIVGFSTLLLVAGNETTTNLLGSMLNRLASAPEVYRELREDRALLRPAIEEALRLDAPAQLVMRRARKDTELAGQRIGAGELVFAYLGAANRDPSRWTEPERFEIERAREGHIAFGFGVHTCLGAPLARLEAELGMSALLQRFEHIEPGSERPRRLPSGVLFGFRSLPLVLR